MLTYSTKGPNGWGRYLVIYQTPGCDVPTVACDCLTRGQADDESARLNVEQVARERTIELERPLCGMRRIRSDAYI